MKGRSALPRGVFLASLLLFAAAAAVAGSVWGRELLGRIEYFKVQRVEVVGARWLAPDSILQLAAIDRGRSVWEDYSSVERRLMSEPLVEEVQVGRAGLQALRIRVRECEPVALIGVPELRPVSADGRLLPIDPTIRTLDLPVLAAPAEPADDSTRLREGRTLEALQAYARLAALDPGIAAIVSDFEPAAGRGLIVHLVESQAAARVAVPERPDEATLRQLRAVLADLRGRGVDGALIEARYANQIVVRRERL